MTLDPDVDRMIRDAMHRTRKSFKATLNRAIRKGLAGEARPPDETPFQVEAHPMGIRAGVDSTRLNQLADDLEVEAFLETTRKLIENSDEGEPPGNFTLLKLTNSAPA